MNKFNMQGIKSSAVFMVIITKGFFDKPPLQEIMYAKNLGKPFRIIKDIGVEIPSWFSESVFDYKEKEVDILNIKNIPREEIVDFLTIGDKKAVGFVFAEK